MDANIAVAYDVGVAMTIATNPLWVIKESLSPFFQPQFWPHDCCQPANGLECALRTHKSPKLHIYHSAFFTYFMKFRMNQWSKFHPLIVYGLLKSSNRSNLHIEPHNFKKKIKKMGNNLSHESTVSLNRWISQDLQQIRTQFFTWWLVSVF